MATRDEILRAGYDLDRAWRGEHQGRGADELLPPRNSGRHELVRAEQILAIEKRACISLLPGDETRTSILKQQDPERHAYNLQRNRLATRVRGLRRQFRKACERQDLKAADRFAGLLAQAEQAYARHLASRPTKKFPRTGWRKGRNEAMQFRPRKES